MGKGDSCYRGEINYTALKIGESLTSSNGKYRLVMQTDGNLVVYCGGNALWASATDGKTVKGGLMFQPDQNLVLYENDAVWASDTDNSGASRLTMRMTAILSSTNLMAPQSGTLKLTTSVKGT